MANSTKGKGTTTTTAASPQSPQPLLCAMRTYACIVFAAASDYLLTGAGG